MSSPSLGLVETPQAGHLVVAVQSLSRVQLFVTRWPAARQASLSVTNFSELAQTHVHRVGDAIQPSHPVVPFSFCLQFFLASGSFLMSQFFTSGDQSTGVSASAPVNIQGWFPLGLTGWITLQSKGLSKVFSNTTVQKHKFFGAQLSLWSKSHIHTWLLEKL